MIRFLIMIKTLLFFTSLTFCIHLTFAQKACTSQRVSEVRMIAPGTGSSTPDKQFTEDFLCATCFHFVQFAVYNGGVNKYDIKAPRGISDIWLIRHNQSYVRGSSHPGAVYMVKAFSKVDEARRFAQDCKRKGLDCWYNPKLSGVRFELLSITQ